MRLKRSLIVVVMALMVTAPAFADVIVNVMAVNGSPAAKESSVKYSLPPELKAEDILDTNSLELDYSVDDASYYVHGKVTLQPKETKTFRVHVKDIWKVTPEQAAQTKKQIEDGYAQLGKVYDQTKADLLKEQLIAKLNAIVDDQNSKAESIERRMDSFRAHVKEMHRVESDALAVDYWRSDPGKAPQEKIIRFKIDVTNPTDKAISPKQKHYLPVEVKAENVVEYEGFDIRFDQIKQQAFLFREDEIPAKVKKSYSIGIRDIWYIHQKDIDYLRSRTNYAYGVLQGSKYGVAAKYLYDRIGVKLADIEASQARQRDNIKEHISAYRVDQRTFEGARLDVEELEKLLSIFREELEKSKVENVLQKVHSLKGVANVAKQMLDKKPTPSTAWTYIGWILLFVGFLTTLNFVVWIFRTRGKKKDAENLPPSQPQETQAKK